MATSPSPSIMRSCCHLRILLCLFMAFIGVMCERKISLLMPDVQPTEKETYLCTAFKMPKNDYEYIVEFQPNATMHTAHHILIYGCALPGYWERDTPRVVWDCGEMGGTRSGYLSGSTCSSGPQVIYAWARDATSLTLPEGVGFKIGGNSGINYLVLQVHYANVEPFLHGATDNSGIFLTLLPSSTEKVTKRAGIYLLGTGGVIPAKTTENMETACLMSESVTLHPFAFRTHTHALGKVVSAYVKKPNGEWKLIGKHDPLKPQMFYPVTNKSMTISQGDIVAARCVMKNFRHRMTSIGSTADDEMCNFYMMYYVNGDKILDEKYCFSSGPPMYRWIWDQQIGDIPEWVDEDANKL